MQKILHTPTGGNRQQPALEPYRELMLKALIAALRLWGGWLPLDRSGRNYLAVEGNLNAQDIRHAINDGVKADLIHRKVSGGMPCIALKEKKGQR